MTPAEPWSFSTGRSTILLTLRVISNTKVRAPRPLVLGIHARTDELHDHELVGVVTGNPVKIARLAIVSLNVKLHGVVANPQTGPGDAVGNGLVHSGADKLVAIALKDNDVFGFDPREPEPCDHLEHQLAGAVGERVTNRVHLDADDVARLEETSPGFDCVGRAGQLDHSAPGCLANRLAILDIVPDHPRMANLDHPSGIRARNAPLCLRFRLI